MMWDYDSGQHVGLLRGGNEPPLAPNQILERRPLGLSPEGNRLVWSNIEKQLQALDTQTWNTLIRTESYAETSAIQVLADSRQVLASGYSKGLFLWDLESGRVVHHFGKHTRSVEWVR
jgi:WD40 repeat protein